MMVSTSILILAVLSANSCRICSTIINYLLDLKHSQQKDSPSEPPSLGLFSSAGSLKAAAVCAVILHKYRQST